MPTVSNIPVPVFGPNGFYAPNEQAILYGVQTDINQAFGGGLNPALETPQGQLATSEAATLGSTFNLICSVFNGVDPAYATGRMQDAIGRIYFIERFPAEPTVVQATCTGIVGLKIPQGSLAIAEDGNIYASTQDGKITANGTVVIPFACQTLGPIPCGIGALDQIYRAIPGWDSITNLSEGSLGRNTESRREFEERRAASVALNAIGYVDAIRGAVLAVNNVLDAYVIDNSTGSPLTIGDYTIPASALYVAVVGGNDGAVARAIWTKKAPGCSYSGNTSNIVNDHSYDPPYPSYTVLFERPPSLPIIFAIDIQNNSSVPSDANVQIQNAIIAAFAGADGGPRARIGGVIYASRFLAPIAALGPWVQVISLQIGSQNTPVAKFTASISSTTMTVTAFASGDGSLAAAQSIIGSGVADGTMIDHQISGSTGSTGTYALTGTAQTVTSETMYAILADQNTVTVGIDQAPTIAAANIAVELTS